MPSVTEHDNWKLTKEKDDVERYLLRIIQRFFEVEVNYSKESVEAIIVESMQRLKRWLYTEKGFIFSLNNKTGHLIIDISFFGGERAFDKNTAFNKDFGNQADTICEGNDSRLSDAREPLTHHHEIDDIETLRERIEAMTFGDGGYYHIHKNKKVLDMLNYTGSRIQIDLILVEWLAERIEDYYGHLQSLQMSVKNTYDNTIDELESRYQELILLLQDIHEYENTAVTWLDEAYKYINTKIERYNNNIMSQFVYYLTKERYDVIRAIYKKAFQMFSDGEIPITDGILKMNPVQTGVIEDTTTDHGDSMSDIYDSGLRIGNDDWTFDVEKNTFVYGHNESTQYQIFASITGYNEYCHRITLASTNSDNDCISVILAYDPDINKHLSLVCVGGGGTCPHTTTHGTTDAFWAITDEYNPTGDGFQFNALIEDTLGNASGWSSMEVNVLVKRNNNHFDIWISRDTMPLEWTVYDTDGNINPVGSPTISFDTDEYSSLSWVSDNKCRYGYGNHSQAQSQYLNVYFNGIGDTVGNETGYTEVSIDNDIEAEIEDKSTFITLVNSKIKMFFRYEDNDGNTHTSTIPFLFKPEPGINAVIKSSYNEDGEVFITTTMNLDVPYYFSRSCIYNNCLYYAVDTRETFNRSANIDHNPMIIIEDSNELQMIRDNLINNTSNYFVQGIILENDFDNIHDFNNNIIPYTEWDIGEPAVIEEGQLSIIAIDAHTGKMRVKTYDSKAGFIGKRSLRKLSDYFHNPRIYYQVIGNEEV